MNAGPRRLEGARIVDRRAPCIVGEGDAKRFQETEIGLTNARLLTR
jgi:hypothetical protein